MIAAMPGYLRRYGEGSTVFLTIVTSQRRPLFAEVGNVGRLRQAFAKVRAEMPFTIEAAVVLHDHLHMLITLPPGEVDYSTRVGRVKVAFTKSLPDLTTSGPTSANDSRARHRERDVWQRRFIEHTIRDESDFVRHVEYAHFNPVKHGLCRCPHEWPHSSFHRWVERGELRRDWYCKCEGRMNAPPSLAYESDP